MSFQIQDIVLYGPPDEPRVLSLRLGQLNVITGASKTGKSALIQIVDYCLGAGECAVAHGPIRDTVEWYGLRLLVGRQQVFVARQAPAKGGESNAAVHYEVGASLEIPTKSGLSANTNAQAAIDLLSLDAGIVDNQHTPPPGQTRAPLAATIRHALHFCFQPQDEIINRKKLFYQQSDHWVAQSIQDGLPYFVGAIGDDHIIKVGRLRRLKHEHRKLMQVVAEAALIRGAGTERVSALLREASDLGLHASPTSPLASYEDGIAVLRQIVDRPLPVPEEQGIRGTQADEYGRLVERRDQLTRSLRRADDEVLAARKLVGERRRYSHEAGERAGRLRSIGLLPKAPTAGHACPLCASLLPGLPDDSAFEEGLRLLEQELGDVAHGTPHLEQLVARLERDAADFRTQLGDTQKALHSLQQQRVEVAEYRDFLARIAHVRGRISIYLESIPSVAAGAADTADRAKRIEEEIAALEEELGKSAVSERLDSILSVISQHITEYGRRLELEHSGSPLRFNPKKLIVVADTPTGPIPMDKMGSGENWVGYHIATHLAFHRQFVEAGRPVPRFLFLDQPSQVYFPADRDVEGRLEIGRESAPIDEDRVAVLRMMELLREHMAFLGGAFQVILTEHADPAVEWYQAAIVERWRGGLKLIPQSWIDAAAAAADAQDEPSRSSTTNERKAP